MSDSNPFLRYIRRTPIVLLAGGAATWLIILSGVILLSREDQAAPTPQPAQRSTLAAATSTAVPSTTPAPTGTPAPTSSPTPTATKTLAPTLTLTPAPTAEPVIAASGTPETAACAPPPGWERYVVQPDDTLFAFQLGSDGAASVDDIAAANCLDSRMLQIGQVLYLPPGAAENAPPSVPAAPASQPGQPRIANCPCTIRVVEGWRREQIAEAIDASETGFSGADFLAVTGPDATAPHDFVSSRPPGTSLEGFLFPGTYTVQNDTTAESFRNNLLDAFAANVSPQVRADAAAQGVTFYEALIFASIVQRESRAPESQKLIASVYYNRYRDGNRLASTVAVQYVLGVPGNWWPRITRETATLDSPYNTNTRAGLPPTPVDNPGLSAILAAVYPAQTNYYYHTAACDGSGEAFSVTYEEHLANVYCE